ncbi:alpha-(1,3)-fucosyltransferase 4-like [Protopterus annectens]|uniref:alpha-(1,3)-fucosyltransferase 4-like n=1 Tax=Protopterus annectens TaxID=7888 RepID=UPI001CFADC2D|nr:alpha-(1,3)-fucosyltransferase 4-like [Protopterus annectens]
MRRRAHGSPRGSQLFQLLILVQGSQLCRWWFRLIWRRACLRIEGCILAVTGLTVVLIIFYICLPSLPLSQLSLPFGSTGYSENRPVTVLVWQQPFGDQSELGDCWSLYNVSGCTVTLDREDYVYADAVLVHHRDIWSDFAFHIPLLPRLPDQKWIWMNFESPTNSPGLYALDDVFNWTMSYRVDSDIFMPYGFLYPKKLPTRKISLPRKTKLVAWVISNWSSDQERVKYYNVLSRYITVDIYGGNELPLMKSDLIPTISRYKFYLAFENSQHRDYITEKLWRNAFKANSVPVVLGPSRSNYELFIPRHSFIHVDDFPTPRRLAMYLKFLDKNTRLYRRYFAWKSRFDVSVLSFWNKQYCTVCEAVRSAGKRYKTITDLASWYTS